MQTPYETGDYDLVVQVSEREFNDQLAAQFAAGSDRFPHQVRQTFDVGLVAGTVNFLFDTPWLHFGTTPQDRRAVSRYDWNVSDSSLSIQESDQITLCLPFSEANLELDNENDTAVSNLDGAVLIQEGVSVHTPGNNQDQREIVLDFEDGVERIEVGFTPETVTRLNDENSVLGALLRGRIQTEFQTMLQDEVRRIGLAPEPIDVHTDDDPVTPADVEAKVLRSGTRALGFFMPTRAGTAGDTSDVTAPSTTGGSPVAILFDADTLLSEIICPALADGLEISEDDFEAPCRLRHSVDVDTSDSEELDDLDFDSLVAEIVDGHVEIRGSFSGSGDYEGFPFDVEGNFELRIFFELEDGELAVRVENDDPNVDVSFPAWVMAAGVALGVLTGGVAGAVVAATVVIIADAVADNVADNMVSGMFAEQVADVDDMNVPLGPAAAGIELDEVDLTTDALALGGRPIRETGMPVAAHSSGEDLTGGMAVDLDSGTVYTSGNDSTDADFVWGSGPSGLGIYARSSAKFAPFSSDAYRSLTVVDLEQAEYESNAYRTFVPSSLVPRQVTVFGLPVGGTLVFAVRTSENRYAKCRVSKSGGTLHLEYVTYDRPTPTVELEVESTIVDSVQVDEGTETWVDVRCMPPVTIDTRHVGGGVETESRSGSYTVDEVERRITVHARTRLLAHPLQSVQWTLDGTGISGRGTVEVDGKTVSYEITGTTCELGTEMGESLDAWLAVGVSDDRSLRVQDSEYISFDGTRKNGGVPPSALEDARDSIDHCIQRRRVPHRGGPRPDPIPPWARVDGLTQPDRLGELVRDAVRAEMEAGDGSYAGPISELLTEVYRYNDAVDAIRMGVENADEVRTGETVRPDTRDHVRTMGTDEASLRRVIERGMGDVL